MQGIYCLQVDHKQRSVGSSRADIAYYAHVRRTDSRKKGRRGWSRQHGRYRFGNLQPWAGKANMQRQRRESMQQTRTGAGFFSSLATTSTTKMDKADRNGESMGQKTRIHFGFQAAWSASVQSPR